MVKFSPLLQLLPFLLAPATLAADDVYTVGHTQTPKHSVMLKPIKDGAGHPVASPYDYQRAGTRLVIPGLLVPKFMRDPPQGLFVAVVLNDRYSLMIF
jgi:hypothetical protein